MKTQITLSKVLKDGQPIFFEKGTNEVDVWMLVGYSHIYWQTMSKKYVQKVCRENGYDYKKMRKDINY